MKFSKALLICTLIRLGSAITSPSIYFLHSETPKSIKERENIITDLLNLGISELKISLGTSYSNHLKLMMSIMPLFHSTGFDSVKEAYKLSLTVRPELDLNQFANLINMTYDRITKPQEAIAMLKFSEMAAVDIIDGLSELMSSAGVLTKQLTILMTRLKRVFDANHPKDRYERTLTLRSTTQTHFITMSSTKTMHITTEVTSTYDSTMTVTRYAPSEATTRHQRTSLAYNTVTTHAYVTVTKRLPDVTVFSSPENANPPNQAWMGDDDRIPETSYENSNPQMGFGCSKHRNRHTNNLMQHPMMDAQKLGDIGAPLANEDVRGGMRSLLDAAQDPINNDFINLVDNGQSAPGNTTVSNSNQSATRLGKLQVHIAASDIVYLWFDGNASDSNSNATNRVFELDSGKHVLFGIVKNNGNQGALVARVTLNGKEICKTGADLGMLETQYVNGTYTNYNRSDLFNTFGSAMNAPLAASNSVVLAPEDYTNTYPFFDSLNGAKYIYGFKGNSTGVMLFRMEFEYRLLQ